jgi:hypothetical protein
MGIGFLLKADLPVGLEVTSAFEPTYPILQQVAEVKRNDQQLSLLPEMDVFMIDQYWIFPISSIPDKDKGIKCDCTGKIASDHPYQTGSMDEHQEKKLHYNILLSLL